MVKIRLSPFVYHCIRMSDVPECFLEAAHPKGTEMVIHETGTPSAVGKSRSESFVCNTLIEQWNILEA